MSTKPTEQQLRAISITERVCSAISLVGTFVIVATFISSRYFRKPINRLVFYASWGNIMANIATLISQDGIHAGVGSPICQFQGFLIQWFMPADALWTFSMACNVYLTFFYKYNSEQLRQLEWKYLLVCYGLPLIPAVAYFFVDTSARGPVYGSAILWCWVALPWDFLRIAIFYGPVWLVIVLTFAIYLRAGSVIYNKRRQLRNVGAMESLESGSQPVSSGSHDISSPKLHGIHVTSEIAFAPVHLRSDTSSCSFDPYTVTVESGRAFPMSVLADIRRSVSDAVLVRHSHVRVDPYCRPESSMNTSRSGDADAAAHRRRPSSESNSAAWAYTKYAMLFFIALLVTWVPSTANRMYSLMRPQDFSFCLNFASSFVLPLQGFWNSLIYISISLPAFKKIWRNQNYRKSEWRSTNPEVQV